MHANAASMAPVERRSPQALAALLATLTLIGCGGDDATDAASRTVSPPPPAQAAGPTGQAGARRLLNEHLAAVGRDDVDAYLTAVADDARFDIGGRELNGRDAVRDFFEGELSGGRYEVLRERPSDSGVTFDLDFRRGGLLEKLTYSYTVRGGRISELVARYR